ncbi:aminoacyl tRNA synthase complex-interacting multifunctional protein 1 [Stegastes partitus]|uniref:Aminoacyl tRNA synthase complex-interacting multifunctional protein 1 n=1 Tax=Stegastes partitus TaxID=144197 RepID=A0A9Y4NAZ8_9TELE|nr:PREDICTED: aminoacyl tRNA synthase complex-interacting multifunctional protein 1-like [Stegastes partitus]
MNNMNSDDLFHPSLAAALMKLDPEDGEQIMEYLKTHVLLSREKALLQASVREQKKLLVENAKLKKDIEQLRAQVQDKQRRRTAKALLSQAPPPHSLSPAPASPVSPPAVSAAPPPPSSQVRREKSSRRRRARPASDPLGAEPQLDVSRLDLRVGRVVAVRRHPLTDTMTVQEVDVGENAPRTVVSKLGEKTHLDQLRGSLVVLLCNVKACKLKGVASQARLLCCSAPGDDVQLLLPPAGSAPGDRVTVPSYHGEPDRELPSRLWEQLQPDVQVDCRGVATYRGSSLQVQGKGLCRGPALSGCSVR